MGEVLSHFALLVMEYRHYHIDVSRWWQIVYLLLVCSLFFVRRAQAQIVTDRAPIGARSGALRSTLLLPTLRLPVFDADSARIEMETTSDLTRTYHFAHKLYADVDIIRDGTRIESQGRTAWFYRVRSKGALSLNFLFSKFYMPEGGALYIYTPDMHRMLGGFGAVNNNKNEVLPTAPIAADEVIIECQIPMGAPTPKLHLSEVNHGVRAGFVLGEPRFDLQRRQLLSCTPDLACMPELRELARGVVVISIDGTSMGTAVLVNNVQNNGVPYLYTASHVISKNCTRTDYEELAKTAVVFFGYDSPSCSGEIRPTEEMSIAGATLVGNDPTTDAALLLLNQSPPLAYNPYYTGWNASEKPQGPFTNIHHPSVLPKRISIRNDEIVLGTFKVANCNFGPDRHWIVRGWDIGTTAAGSSGSPLFDTQGLVVGVLTGGETYCSAPGATDAFSALPALANIDHPGARAIMQALRGDRRVTSCAPYDPTQQVGRLRRLSHVVGVHARDSLKNYLFEINRDRLLGIGGQANTRAVGEVYQLEEGCELYGFYTIFAHKDLRLKESIAPIRYAIYDQDTRKELTTGEIRFDKLVGIEVTSVQDFVDKERTQDDMMELFVPFEAPIKISKKGGYFVALIRETIDDRLTPLVQAKTQGNSTLYRLYGDDKWVASSQDAEYPLAAALWIDLLSTKLENDAPTEESEAPFSMTAYNDQSITFGVHCYQDIKTENPQSSGTLTVHDLRGRTLFYTTFDNQYVTLSRHGLEGRGVIIVTITYGDKTQHYKLYLPTT